MWESRQRFPREVGRVENLGLVFQTYTDRHFHSCMCHGLAPFFCFAAVMRKR